jgi:pimeloyl-ACP methyl ester carboxylesterase
MTRIRSLTTVLLLALAATPTLSHAFDFRKPFVRLKVPGQAGGPIPRATRTAAGMEWRIGEGDHPINIVYLHGLGSEPQDGLVNRLVKQLAQTGKSYRVIAPYLQDVKEIDGKMVPVGPHTMTGQLERARAVLRDTPGYIIGHSFGGKAANALGKEFHDTVKGVIELAPSVNMLYAYWKNLTGQKGVPQDREQVLGRLDAHETWLRQELKGVVHRLAELGREGVNFADEEEDHPSEATRLLRKNRSLRSELSYHATMRDLVGHDEAQLESGIHVPTLLLHGTDDQAVSIHYAKRFAEANPAVRMVELPGLGHGLDNPKHDRAQAEEVDRRIGSEIARFLEQQERPGGAP